MHAMVEAVSCGPLKTEAKFQPMQVRVMFVVDRVILGQTFLGSTEVFPLSLSFCGCTVHIHSYITDAIYLQQLTA
jgi:hypothetical protein